MKFTLLLLHILFPFFTKGARDFAINPTTKSFVLDGSKPFQIISGTFHYFQCPPDYWEERMIQMKALGLNTLQTYVQWSLHEPKKGLYDFTGRFDFFRFLGLAEEHGFFVILRPGPYIDAERGLPPWLLREEPDIQIRSSDPKFLKFVDSWFDYFLPMLHPYMYIHGGMVLMVQIENEYGFFGCDLQYTTHLKSSIQRHLGPVFLYTTDGCSLDNIRCGRVPDAYSTVDFSASSSISNCFDAQRVFEPNAPNMNSEFYPGWTDHWGIPHHMTPAQIVAKSLDDILKSGASVNIYPVYGGTMFGFEGGAKLQGTLYTPSITSYDFDAPISESGDVTPKYFELKKVIEKYVNSSDIPDVPKNKPKGNYGMVKLSYGGSLSDFLNKDSVKIVSKYPITFEQFGQDFGFLSYTTKIKDVYPSPASLHIPGLRDRAYILIDGIPTGIILSSMFGGIYKTSLNILKGQNLTLIVENLGRVDFGPGLKSNFKGIVSNVTLNGHILTHWEMRGRDLNGESIFEYSVQSSPVRESSKENSFPLSLWIGSFTLPCTKSSHHDTFLKLSHWNKGLAFLNGFNLGRYWPRVGPQETLYVPGVLLIPHCNIRNMIFILETDSVPKDPGSRFVELTDKPSLNGPTPISNI